MSAYNELIKNFEKIRSYMREFYIYGFKNRSEYDKKSSRSYDDERRRMESWLGDYMSFVRTPEGKNVFISIDSRISRHNPFYRAWKAKSFTDREITLHFIILDILHSPEIKLTLSEVIEKIDTEYLSFFEVPMVFDESTVRKKLKEYTALGLVEKSKEGRKTLYSRTCCTLPENAGDLLNFYSETAPCGVIGSFLLDKESESLSPFTFKHHYITSALDSSVLADIFLAMREKKAITVTNHSRRATEPRRIKIIPLRILASVQNGRQHLLAYDPAFNVIKSFRIDYLSDVKAEDVSPRFEELRCELESLQKSMWGVTARRKPFEKECLEHVDFTVKINPGEEYIIRRLEREKRVGTIEKIDDFTYRFSAELCDSGEIKPWIRTFICRITDVNFSNGFLKTQFENDLKEMYRMYNVKEENL